MIINVSLFLHNYFKYQGHDWNHLRAVVHNGLPVARGAAGVINFNCALILIPVCRNLINFLRGCFGVRRLQNWVLVRGLTRGPNPAVPPVDAPPV